MHRPSPSSAAVLVADLDGRIHHAEGTAFAAGGVRPEEWLGRTLEEVLAPDAAPSVAPRLRQALAGVPQSFGYDRSDGRRSYWINITPVRDRDGELRSVVAVTQDITDQLRVRSELERSETRLRQAERMIGLGSWEMCLATGEITFSDGFARLIGVTVHESVTLDTHLRRVHPDDRTVLTGAGRRCIAVGSATCEYRVFGPDDAILTLSLRAELVLGPSGKPAQLRGAVVDVTDQRRAERERLEAEIRFRQGFDATAIGTALADPVSGICLRVNDAMCRLLRRSQEELLGESIGTVVHGSDRGVVLRAANEMLAGERSEYQAEHQFSHPDGTLAWGMLHVTPLRRHDGSLEVFYFQLIDISEQKEREERLEHDVGDAVWLGRIRDALDEQRLLLYAQPIVDLMTGETVQHELLLRMRAPDGSIVAPGEFLPAAERYGLIAEIDRWVIREAARIAATGTPTEFNLSGRSIGDPSVLSELANAIETTGVDPALLVVEVTETAFIDQTEAGHKFAQRVRELGCRLALDDFGTGFSSLSYLKHIPADHLKIDIDFVRELRYSETDARVVRGIVALAREFHQTTIAEGVEDEATLVMLKELGVDLAQGYLFGAPEPRSDAPEAPSPGRPAAAGAADPIAVVRDAFAGFARRDLPSMLARCTPDLVMRPLVTSRETERTAPYRGHEGLMAYLSDVDAVWDELRLVPFTFRQAQDAVIGFGRAEACRNGDRLISSIMWVVRMRGDLIAAIEVFQAAAGSAALSPLQEERLSLGVPAGGAAPTRAA